MIKQTKKPVNTNYTLLPHQNKGLKSIFNGSNLFPLQNISKIIQKDLVNKKYEELIDQNKLISYQLKSSNASLRETIECANLLAHSLKSPLSAIQLIANNCDLPLAYKSLIKMTCNRMKETINEIQLLDTANKVSYKNEKIYPTNISHHLSKLCENINYMYKNETEISFDYNLIKTSINCKIPIKSFNDAIFNIIKNSYESIDYKGHIFITMYKINSKIEIVITDNGKGIPSFIQPLIGTKSISYGKKEGTGVGLYQVKKMLDKCNGQMKITSLEKKGTQIKLIFPILN